MKKYMKFLKMWIKKSITLYALGRFIKNINNKNFLNKIINIDRDPNVMRYIHYGNKNKDKIIYYINIDQPKAGFFAFFSYVLYGLYEAERFKFIPVVRYGDCIYKESISINGTDNPFEYYFKPVSNVSVEEIYQSDRVIPFEWAHRFRDFIDFYKSTESDLERLSKVCAKYIFLNDITEKYIEDSIKKLFINCKSNKILGIHIRGTDFALNWNNHPNMISGKEYIHVIDKILEKNDFDYLFLATDDENRLNELKDIYKDKLIYYTDVNRGTKNINIAFEKNNRKNNHYLNGLEVLRDAYTLASCSGLLAGISSVSMSARIIKYSRNEKYKYLKILNKGLYKCE